MSALNRVVAGPNRPLSPCRESAGKGLPRVPVGGDPSMSSPRSLALALLPALLMTPLAASAQPAPAAPAAAPGPQLPKITRVLVGSATDLGVDAESRPAHLGLWLTLDAAGLDTLEEKAKAAKKPLQLY